MVRMVHKTSDAEVAFAKTQLKAALVVVCVWGGAAARLSSPRLSHHAGPGPEHHTTPSTPRVAEVPRGNFCLCTRAPRWQVGAAREAAARLRKGAFVQGFL